MIYNSFTDAITIPCKQNEENISSIGLNGERLI